MRISWWRRPWRLGAVIALVVVVAGGSVMVIRSKSPDPVHTASACATTASTGGVYPLDLDQAANASTIAAIGKRLGLADHAVTIALATALQESQLRNLPGGDRDSKGLFQQRPSQGWGTAAQVTDVNFATVSFYQHLQKVDHWQNLPVAEAAQAVQHSAAPHAYARWEPQARAMAQALTGEVPAGFVCQYAATVDPPSTQAAEQALSDELGGADLGSPTSSAKGWTIATWLVAHARLYHLDSVSFQGRTWTPGIGRWDTTNRGNNQVQI